MNIIHRHQCALLAAVGVENNNVTVLIFVGGKFSAKVIQIDDAPGRKHAAREAI